MVGDRPPRHSAAPAAPTGSGFFPADIWQPLRVTVTRLTPIFGLWPARCGNRWTMLILAILLVLALIFGVGSVLEGLAWGFLIAVALLVAAAFYGYKKLVR